MLIDPNTAVQLEQEDVLCEHGHLELWDGQVVAPADLLHLDNPFAVFCQSLDPNRCFIHACVMGGDEDRSTFFRARDLAGRLGRHMQASVDMPAQLRRQWDNYCRAKRRQAAQRRDAGITGISE